MGFHQHQKESPCNQKKFMDGAKGADQKPSPHGFCWVARPDFAAGQVVLLWWQQYEGHQWHQRCRYRGLRRSTPSPSPNGVQIMAGCQHSRFVVLWNGNIWGIWLTLSLQNWEDLGFLLSKVQIMKGSWTVGPSNHQVEVPSLTQ